MEGETRPWVLYVWEGTKLQGPLDPGGEVPLPGDRLPVAVQRGEASIEVRIIQLSQTTDPIHAYAVSVDAPVPRLMPASSGRTTPAPLREEEKFTLAELVENARHRQNKETRRLESVPPEHFTVPAPPADTAEPAPEAIGRDEPDIGGVVGTVLGRDNDSGIRLRDLRARLVPTLRRPLRNEITRLRKSGIRQRKRLIYLERRFQKMLQHLNVLEKTFQNVPDATEAEREKKVRLVRWIVSENAMLREEINRWLRFEPLLRYTQRLNAPTPPEAR